MKDNSFFCVDRTATRIALRLTQYKRVIKKLMKLEITHLQNLLKTTLRIGINVEIIQ